MRRGSPTWTVRVLLAATTLFSGVLGAAWLPSPTASAADPESWVSISIDSMSPALPSRDGTVRLTGTIRSTSTEPLYRLQAVLWRSLDPISDNEGMDRALASDANEPLGSRVRPGRIFQNIPSDTNRTLAPGQSSGFDLTADLDDFELPGDDAVYLIGVQVRGRVGTSGDDEILGRGRIFMPLVDAGAKPDESEPQPDAASRPQLEVASVVLLASRPSLVRSGVLSDDHLAAEIGPSGRLRILLEAARRPSASFAVDPATIEELETMRRGYSVLTGNGETTAGTGQAAAERWLADFARLRSGGNGFRVLFGSPDLTALVHDSQRAVIDASAAAGNATDSTRSLPLVVLPTAGRADAATVSVADSLRPRAILLSESSARGPRALLSGPGTAPIVSYRAAALTGGPGPAPSRTPVKIRQRALADSWLAADAAADSGETAARAEVRLITTVEQADALSQAIETEKAPWIKPVTLRALLAGTPAEWDEQFVYGSKATDAELSPGQLGTVRRLAGQFGTYADLLVDPERATAQAQVTLPRAASGQWRSPGRTYAGFIRGVEQGLAEVLRDQVSISLPARVLTTGRDARFPITVYNNLPAVPGDPQFNSIRVVVRFRSANSQRLTVAPVELPPLPAGTNRTENVQVRAETNGSVEVTAELRTRSGQPVGQPVPVLVNATQAGTTGWIIAIVAGFVLVGTTALRIRQVAKERSAEPDTKPVLVSRPPADSAESGSDSPAASPDAGRDRDRLDV